MRGEVREAENGKFRGRTDRQTDFGRGSRLSDLQERRWFRILPSGNAASRERPKGLPCVWYGTSRERVRDCVWPSPSAELVLRVCCTDSCWCRAVLLTTRLVRFSRHVMIVWEMDGHRTRYASAEVCGEVEGDDLGSSVER